MNKLNRLNRLNEKQLFKMNLSFFDSGDKTEKPTAKKRKKARKEGQVAKSPEVSTAFLLIAVFFAFKLLFPSIIKSALIIYTEAFNEIRYYDKVYEVNELKENTKYIMFMFFSAVGPILGVSFLVSFISNYIQVGWHPTTKPLKPKFSKLNPIKGVKKIISFAAVMNLFKSIGKLAVIGFTSYIIIKDKIPSLINLFAFELIDGTIFVGKLIIDLGIGIGFLFLAIALIDYIYQKLKLTKDLKMSKQEIKEEYKSVEGNPLIKGKIKQKMLEASMRRMMDDVPTADVIITNPTHYAVAIKYDPNGKDAPQVVAKGKDHLAKKIRELGKESNIEIVENKILARTLYATVDIGKEIPEELYQSVAEVLAYVYKLKNKV